MASDMARKGYRFVVVKVISGKPGHYIIQRTPPFQNNALRKAKNDSGSLRQMLASKVRMLDKSRKRAKAAEERGDPTLDYIDKKLAGKDLVSNGCSELLENIDFADVDWDKELSELDEEIKRKIQLQHPRESKDNDHDSASEALADKNTARLVEFLVTAENDPPESWDDLHPMLRDIGMCPELVADFEKPNPQLGTSRYRQDVANILLDVVIFKQAQCTCCYRKSSDCKTRKELRSFQYDHLKDFTKCFDLTSYHTEGEECPISTAEYCKRLLFELRKGKISFVACHEAGSSTGRHEDQLRRPPTLQIGPRPTSLYGDDNPLRLRDVFKLKEFWLFVKFCYTEGMWSQSRIGSKASLDKINIICYKLFGMLATDQMKVTKDEWENEVHRTVRRKYATDVIAHVAARLSGKCPGCGECFLNYNAVRLRINEWNHRIPRRGDEDSNTLSALRDNLLEWLKEAEDGDCEGTCHSCHKDVNAFQQGGDRPLWYTGE
jgi:hypothetical protein